MLLAALVPLGLGIAGDFYVVTAKVLKAPETALALSAASLVFFFGLWFGMTLASARAAGAARRVARQSSRSMIAALAMPPPSQMAVRA